MEQGHKRVLNEKIAEAVETIKAYCETRTDCEGCCLYNDEWCFFAMYDLPCDWTFSSNAL